MDGTGRIYVYICRVSACICVLVHWASVCGTKQKGAFRGVCELVKVTHVSPQYMRVCVCVCVCGINVGK